MLNKNRKYTVGQRIFWKFIDDFYYGTITGLTETGYLVELECKNFRTDEVYYEEFEVEEKELYSVTGRTVKYEGFKLVPLIN